MSNTSKVDDQKEILFGMLEAAAEHGYDFPDGAYMQHLEDAVKAFNRMNHTRFDPNETVMEWFKSIEAD